MQRENVLVAVADVVEATALLTRLPVPAHGTRGAAAAWAWPVAGALVGGIAGGTAALAVAAGCPAGLAAVLALAAGVVLTGGLHEDGCADTCDGLWGGWTPARRLEIMRDSRIGTYGVLGLGLAMLARWSALAGLIGGGDSLVWMLAAVGALSRAPMAAILWALPNARGDGLAHAVGRPQGRTVALAGAVALLAGATLLGQAVVPVTLAVAAAAAAVAMVARARIGGQTGDILGAAQVAGEVAALAVLATLAG